MAKIEVTDASGEVVMNAEGTIEEILKMHAHMSVAIKRRLRKEFKGGAYLAVMTEYERMKRIAELAAEEREQHG